VDVRLIEVEQPGFLFRHHDDLCQCRDNQPPMVAGQLSLGGKPDSSSMR
jgi:hypothetical protein